MLTIHVIGPIVLVGIGATAVMDVWLWLLSRLGVPTSSFAMVGRWVGHMARGRIAHAAISKAPPIRFELGIGWLTHYAVGIAFAAVLIVAEGVSWLAQPTLVPALTVGVLTVTAPWLVMQPAMGSGLLASKTPAPLQNCLRNLVNHAIFGAGLYLAAMALAAIAG